MLEELRNLKFPGTKDAIIFTLRNISEQINPSVKDMSIICAHAPRQYSISIDAMLDYCQCFGFAEIDGGISISVKLQHYVKAPEQLNRYLVEKSVDMLFEAEILLPQMFSFEITTKKILFHNESLPLEYATIRNVLVSQEFFDVFRSPAKTVFYVNTKYERIVSSFCLKHKEKMTLIQLQKKLEENAAVGIKAEKFVLDYERRRLGEKCFTRVKLISDIDVCAGYDIISFNTKFSTDYDRFIEVKAVSSGNSFYWSSNEYNTAKLKGEQYFLYLVSLSQIDDEGYSPTIVQNPAHTIMEAPEWLVESESYHIRRVPF